MLDQADLRPRRSVAIQEQPMMDVVAPESAIDEGQRIVVLADRGGHAHQNLAGENALRSKFGFKPRTTCDMTTAVTGASKIPSR